jgi:hypothetical protein
MGLSEVLVDTTYPQRGRYLGELHFLRRFHRNRTFFSMPFPRKGCAWTARFSCQGRPLRSRKREANAPLTAQAAGRPGPPGMALVFYAPLRVASKARINALQSSSHAANQTTTFIFTRPSRRCTRRVGRPRKIRPGTAGFPLAPFSRRAGRPVRGRPTGKPVQLGTQLSDLLELPHCCGR